MLIPRKRQNVTHSRIKGNKRIQENVQRKTMKREQYKSSNTHRHIFFFCLYSPPSFPSFFPFFLRSILPSFAPSLPLPSFPQCFLPSLLLTTQIFHLPVHLSNETELSQAGNSIFVSHMSARDPSTLVIVCCFSACTLAKSWIKARSRTWTTCSQMGVGLFQVAA